MSNEADPRSAASINHIALAPRGTSRRAKFLLATCGVGSAFLIAELLLRVGWNNPYSNDQPDRVVELALNTPGRDQLIDRSSIDPRHPHVRFRTNDRGYIEPSAIHDSPMATIAFLGGSTTECSAVREELRFPALVGKGLTERGFRVNTLNAGRSGNTTHDALNLLLNHVIADAPDIVVLMHATNDIGVLNRFPGYEPRLAQSLSSFLILEWCLEAASQRSSLVGLFRRLYSRPRVVRGSLEARSTTAEVAAVYERRMLAFVHLAQDLGMRPILMTQPLSPVSNELTPVWGDAVAQTRFNDVIRSVAEKQGIALIDLVRYLEEDVDEWQRDGVVFYDGMHVNDAGSRIYANHIVDRLVELIAPGS